MSYLGEDIKKLGFGCMRFPKKDGKIDLEQTKQMIDLFMKEGFNYFDTAWAYIGSEEALKEVLVKRYPRESYILATKNAAWIECETKEDAMKQFTTSLEQTGAGYFDFYLLHNLGEARTKYFDKFDMWEFVKKLKEEGKVKHIGFSFHSTPEELEEILQKHPEMEFVQLQINYGDWENPAIKSRECYEMARKYGMPVIIMEPVKGGTLANPPESVKKIFDEANPNASYASWAIKFAANLDGIVTVLSGMSNLEQVKDNISNMKDFTHLSENELKTINKVQEELSKIPLIPCTTCNYCAKVCPMNIGISGSFTAMNIYNLYSDLERAKQQQDWLVTNHGFKTAGNCIKCGKCEEACPQHIKIREELEKVSEILKK